MEVEGLQGLRPTGEVGAGQLGGALLGKKDLVSFLRKEGSRQRGFRRCGIQFGLFFDKIVLAAVRGLTDA